MPHRTKRNKGRLREKETPSIASEAQTSQSPSWLPSVAKSGKAASPQCGQSSSPWAGPDSPSTKRRCKTKEGGESPLEASPTKMGLPRPTESPSDFQPASIATDTDAQQSSTTTSSNTFNNTPIHQPNDDDVLLTRWGGHGGPHPHVGNARYRALIVEHQSEYNKLDGKGKRKGKLAKKILWIIKSRGGRFLSKTDKDSDWYIEVGEERAVKKVLHAFRVRKCADDRMANLGAFFNENDVLVGGPPSHVGNARFHALIAEHQSEFNSLDGKGKKKGELGKKMLSIVESRGGRFLSRDKESGSYVEVGEKRALSRTLEMFRVGKSDDEEMRAVCGSDEEKEREARGIGKSWNDMFFELVCYKNEKGDCNVPSQYTDQMNLGKWVSDMRHQYRELHGVNVRRRQKEKKGIGKGDRNGLPKRKEEMELNDPRKVKALETIGFVWSFFDAKWELRFEELKKYKEEHGHCNVSQHKSLLGRWVNEQRILFFDRAGKSKTGDSLLKPERKAKLDSIGFEWKLQDRTLWEDRYQELVTFRAEHGHCRVPQHYIENRSLGKWVTKQRYEYNMKRRRVRPLGQCAGLQLISDERIARLNELGFTWGNGNRRSRAGQGGVEEGDTKKTEADEKQEEKEVE